jgi:hypothetical protein
MGKGGGLRLDLGNEDHRKLLEGRGIDVGSLLREKPSLSQVLPKGGRRKEPGKSKYGNKKERAFGRIFDSVWEMECYAVLLSLEQEGKIHNLETQVHFDFIVNGVKIYGLDADFVFRIIVGKHGRAVEIVADAKSVPVAKTVKWRMQVKLMKALYQKDILVFYKKVTNVKKITLELIERVIESSSTDEYVGQRK